MEKYKVEIKKSAVKEIESLPRQEIKVILEKIASLADNPRPFDSKKLSHENKYRVRSGKYRIIYNIEGQILFVYVVKVGHRKNVYR